MNISDDEDRGAGYGKRPTTDSGALFRVPVLTGEQIDAAYRAAGVSSVTSWHAAIDWYARQMVRADVPPPPPPPEALLIRLELSSIAAALNELVGVTANAGRSILLAIEHQHPATSPKSDDGPPRIDPPAGLDLDAATREACDNLDRLRDARDPPAPDAVGAALRKARAAIIALHGSYPSRHARAPEGAWAREALEAIDAVLPPPLPPFRRGVK